MTEVFKIKYSFLQFHFDVYNELKNVCSFSEYLYYQVGIILNPILYKDFLDKNNVLLVDFTPNESDAIRICNIYFLEMCNKL